MSYKYLKPPRILWPAHTTKVFCLSDVHLGNSRPTNDLGKSNKARLLKVLDKIRAELVPGNLHSFDLVLNGDTFDFWKAVPNPLPSEDGSPGIGGYRLHDYQDYIHRFNEILTHNNDVITSLANILFKPDPEEMGVRLYILTGNHDDPASSQLHGTTEFRTLLVRTIAQAGIAAQKIPSFMHSAYFVGINDRVYWDAPQIYHNRRMKLHIQHGHRWDNHNILRESLNAVLWSEGQIIVEHFLNGLHDINLNTYEFGWEEAEELSPILMTTLRNIDNFTDPLNAERYAMAIAAPNVDVKMLFRKHGLSAFWMADQKTKWTLATLPWISDVMALIYKYILRGDHVKILQKQALALLGNPINKIVLLGHTHIYDAEPPLNRSPVPQQYVNTGTFVDVLQYKPSNPTKPRVLDYMKPVKVFIIPQKKKARVQVWKGSNWDTKGWNDVILP